MPILPKGEATPLLKEEATPLLKGEATPLLKRVATRLHPRTFLVLQGTEDPPQNLRSRGALEEDCFQGKDCWERQ